MSLYRDAIATSVGRPAPSLPVTLVRVEKVIPTPHGNVIAGEVVEGEYIPPGVQAEIGWSLKKGLKKFGKGVAKGVKATAKATGKVTKVVAKTAYKVHAAPIKLAFKGTKAVGKGAFKVTKAVGKGVAKGAKATGKGVVKVTKKTGKTVAKGTKAGVKWVKKNPVKALALATLPASAALYATYKVTKGVGKVAAKGAGKLLGGGGSAPELGPAEEEQQEAPYSEEEMTPESYPGEEYSSEEAYDEQQPDALEAPEPEYSEEETSSEEEYSEEPSSDEYAADEGEASEEYSDEGAEGYSEETDAEVSGMPQYEEYVGLEEIAGEDEEWVGADEIAGPAPKPKGKPGPNKALVRNVGYSKARRQGVPLNSTGDVAAGGSAVVTAFPQTLFRGRKLVVGSAIAPSFLIQDIKVGTQSQNAASGSIPAEAFTATATGEDNIQMDTCRPGMAIALTVQNTSGGPLAFNAVLFGDSVQ